MASIEKRVRDGQTSWRTHYRTPSGAQRSKSFTRKVDAERFRASVENSKITGTYVDPTLAKVTVGAWAERWLDGQTHLKPTTRSRYDGIVRKHIHPKWDGVRLANVSHGDVQSWVTELARGHSPATVQKIHRVLSRWTTWSSPASATASRCGSAPSGPRSVPRPERSACSASTRTSSRIPPQALRSPAAPTSRLSNRCWGSAQRR